MDMTDCLSTDAAVAGLRLLLVATSEGKELPNSQLQIF